MELHVFLAVLAAAALHASWNALIKAGGDPLLSMTHMAIPSLAFALIATFFVAMPVHAAWPWLLLSVTIHTGYRLALVEMYRHGDMGQVYPIARGAAPFLTAVLTYFIIGEGLSISGYAGICLLGLGVILLSVKGGRLGDLKGKAVGAALLTSLWTSAYSFTDGYGARVNGSGPSYAIWLFVLENLANLALGFFLRGKQVIRTWPDRWQPATGAGAMSQLAYFIAIWAMTQAPIALVAALRETSVLFAALIAVFYLREPMTSWRIAAAVIVVAGVMLLRLG